MISLNRLQLKNFRSFNGTHTIVFSNGFYCIKGFSGVGKSNILLGISYALGLSPIPATQLKNVFTDEAMEVRLELDKDGHKIEICRGPNPAYTEQGVGTWNGASVVNEKVKALFDGQLESVDLLTIRNQRTNGRFLSLDDSDKKSFLSTILGLTKLENMIEFQKEKLKDAKTQQETLRKQVETAKSFMPKHTPDDLVYIQGEILKCKEENKINSALNDKARTKYREIESIRQTKITEKFRLLEAHTKKISNFTEELANEKKNLASMDVQIKEHVTARNMHEGTVLRLERELKNVGKTLAKNFESMAALKANNCYTCGQFWDQGAEAEKALLKSNVDLRNQEAQLTKSIEDLYSTISNLSFKIPIYEQERTVQANKIELLASSIPEPDYTPVDADLEALTTEGRKFDTEANLALFEWNKINKNIAVWQSKYDRALKDAEDAAEQTKALGELNNKLLASIAKYDRYKLCIELNKEFLTKIFDEILFEISDNVNSNLSLIPNVKNISFEFTTVNTTKDGVVKNKIETNIYKNGIKMPGISGGQTSSLELLVDASVHSVISARTGLSLNWLILDEPFEGLHPQDKEACLEVLKKLHPNKCVLIVDHSTETKEHFDGFFEVFANNDGSSEIKATK